ncbi:MAG: regulatory protein RecX [Bacilli bacterium]|nr:regulatory protein RecX [Bacilli bacterium]
MKMYKVNNVIYFDKEVIVTYSDNVKQSELKISLENYLDNPLVISQEISLKVIEEFKRKEEYLKLKNYAFLLIGKYEYSSYKLLKVLSKKYNNEKDIKKVIKEFTKKGYLNDDEYISNYIEKKISKKYGTSRIKMELLNEGFEKVDESLFEKYIDIEIANAESLAKKYMAKYQNVSSEKLKQKLYRYLYGLGYQEHIIEQIFKKNNLTYY